MNRVAVGGLAIAVLIAGCGANRYGYARTYEPLGDEGPYAAREVDLSYDDVRRFPDRYAHDLVGWFGVVRDIQDLDAHSGQARLLLDLRIHQERHLCSDETAGSCRVTVSDRSAGPFIANVHLRPEDLAVGPERINRGSLVKIYGHVREAGTDETGPVIEADWYRQWPHGYYVTTGSRESMRQ